jgi:hypothetical protein
MSNVQISTLRLKLKHIKISANNDTVILTNLGKNHWPMEQLFNP